MVRISSGLFQEKSFLFHKTIFLILNLRQNGGTIPAISNHRPRTKNPINQKMGSDLNIEILSYIV